jgi:hypothetical protein
MQWAKLNVFQRLTRRWDAIHPYNAAQAMKLAGAPDRQRLAQAWRSTLKVLGIGQVRFAGKWFRHEPLDGQWVASDLVAPPPDTAFDAFISDALNRPFAPSESPLRPFVIAQDDAHWIGVVYHHWIADSASIRLLLREWFFRMYHPDRARREPVSFPAGGYRDHVGPRTGGWNYFDASLAAMRWGARMRRARRVEAPDFDQYITHFSLHHLPDRLVERLLTVARSQGATLNDVFLTVVAQVCDELVPVKRTPRRPDLALGSIVDLRSRAAGGMSDAFGLFLGFTSVVVHSDDAPDFPRLLRTIAAQNAHLKRTAGPESSMLRMAAGLAIHRIYSQSKALNWYRKRIPLAGGISNVNLNRDWPAEFHPHPLLEYARVSPLGPMMPIVFTTTTLGEQLNFGLTCRESVIPRDLSAQIAALFCQRLMQIAHTGV